MLAKYCEWYSVSTLDLFTHIVQPDLLSSMLNVKDAQFQLLTASLSDASLGEFSYRAPSPPKKKKTGGVAALCGRAPLGALPSPSKKKRRGKRSRKEITYDHEGCFLDGCLTPLLSEVAQATILISTFGS